MAMMGQGETYSAWPSQGQVNPWQICYCGNHPAGYCPVFGNLTMADRLNGVSPCAGCGQ